MRIFISLLFAWACQGIVDGAVLQDLAGDSARKPPAYGVSAQVLEGPQDFNAYTMLQPDDLERPRSNLLRQIDAQSGITAGGSAARRNEPNPSAGLHAYYQRANLDGVEALTRKYKSVPGEISVVRRLPEAGGVEPRRMDDLRPAWSSSTLPAIQPGRPDPANVPLTARYERVSLQRVAGIVERYKSIPGGVTLEGAAVIPQPVREVAYDALKNIFILNGRIQYESPLDAREFRELVRALKTDDRVGVSLGDTDVIYGGIAPGSLSCIYLKMTDHFLGSIVFANSRWTSFHSFPGGYRPRQFFGAGDFYAVYFNFSDYRFSLQDDRLSAAGSDLAISLIPLTAQQGPNGGYLPDYLKVAGGLIPAAYEANVAHIVSHIAEYQQDVRVQHANRCGEAAAFIRAVRDAGLSLDQIEKQLGARP